MAGQPDKYASCVVADEKYMLVLNHEGRWAAEDMLDLEWPEIMFRYNNGRGGTRVQSAIIYALTRKHHGRELPDARSVTRLLDRIDGAEEDEVLDFTFAMTAAIAGVTKKEVRKDYEERMAEEQEEPSLGSAEDPDQEDEEEESDASGDPKGEDPEDSEPSKTTKKPTPSRSGAGKRSS